MNKIKWIFFDIGSTLVDESECLRERFNIIVNENGINEQEFKDKIFSYSKTHGHPIKPVARLYSVQIPKWNKDLERLYPDVESILNILSHSYRLGIIANQAIGITDRLNNWGIGKYFDIIISSAEEGVEKPDPKIFKLALDRAGCSAYEAVMIGDRLDNDIAPANKMGMKTVWVRQGFAEFQAPSNDDEIPDFTIERIGDIINIFRH